MKIDCPKCGSESAWYVKSKHDLTLKCFCGYHKVVFTTLSDGMTIEHREKPQAARLPKPGTHLRATLSALAAMDQANSREITDRLVLLGYDFSVSDVSSYLTMLRSRGLVDSMDSKRGIPGGSTWQLTDQSIDLLCL